MKINKLAIKIVVFVVIILTVFTIKISMDMQLAVKDLANSVEVFALTKISSYESSDISASNTPQIPKNKDSPCPSNWKVKDKGYSYNSIVFDLSKSAIEDNADELLAISRHDPEIFIALWDKVFQNRNITISINDITENGCISEFGRDLWHQMKTNFKNSNVAEQSTQDTPIYAAPADPKPSPTKPPSPIKSEVPSASAGTLNPDPEPKRSKQSTEPAPVEITPKASFTPNSNFETAPHSHSTQSSDPQHIIAKIHAVFGSEGPKAVRVARCESSLYPRAYNGSDPHSGSYGLFQINGVHFRYSNSTFAGRTAEDFYNIDFNIQAAYTLWKSSGWGIWGCKNA